MMGWTGVFATQYKRGADAHRKIKEAAMRDGTLGKCKCISCLANIELSRREKVHEGHHAKCSYGLEPKALCMCNELKEIEAMKKLDRAEVAAAFREDYRLKADAREQAEQQAVIAEITRQQMKKNAEHLFDDSKHKSVLERIQQAKRGEFVQVAKEELAYPQKKAVGVATEGTAKSLPEGFTRYGGEGVSYATDQEVSVVFRNGSRDYGLCRGFSWQHSDHDFDIIAYKLIGMWSHKKETASSETGLAFEGKPSVCAEADKVIKDRHETYGSPKKNFNDIAALWDVAFGHKMCEMFTAADVAQAMRLVKEARLINDPTHRDSLVDICGYAECQNEVNNGAVVGGLA